MRVDTSIPVYVYPDANALGIGLASVITQGVRDAIKHETHYLLGCPSGRSAASTYVAIGRLAAEENIDMSRTIIVMMDDYVLYRDGSYVHCPEDAHYSCIKFARESIRDVVNSELPDAKRIPEEHLWVPDPANPEAYDAKIMDAGGIDLFIVASGASDGHVAFNPPGSDSSTTTRIIELAVTTRRDNLGTFPEFDSLDDVPEYGVSVGVHTIVSCSTAVACVIHGEHKNGALREMVSREAFDPEWPVSLIYDAKTIGLFVDEAAASGVDFDSNHRLERGA
jgi:glucosamine-6-phosphate deaminase